VCVGGLCSVGCGAADAGTFADAGAATPVGASCSSDSDCGRGSCDTSWPGGYCTERCSTAGAQDTCPDDSVCALLCPGRGVPRCLQRCQVPGGCRTNYTCATESSHLFAVCQPASCDPPGPCLQGAICGPLNECDEATCLAP